MEEVTTTTVPTEATTVQALSILDLPVARLQIVTAKDTIEDAWLERKKLEPILECNADGLWVLSVRRQGEHSKFEVPFIGSEIILADAELGLVVVLVGYHGSTTEKYGKLGYLTQKGQFYRYYRQEDTGGWQQVYWRNLNDELRTLIISTVEESGLSWARKPGKLNAERNPPTKHAILTTYKVVRYIDGRFFSLYDPGQEYILGEKVKEPVKPKHGGGFFSYPTIEMGKNYFTSCLADIPFHAELETQQLALLEVEVSGKCINYGHKMCSTYLKPMRVLEIRDVLN